MPFKKGDPNINRHGRPVKAKNIIPADLKQDIFRFLADRWPMLRDNFDRLDIKEKFTIFERLMKYYYPVQKESTDSLTIENLTDGELTRLIDVMIKQNENKG